MNEPLMSRDEAEARAKDAWDNGNHGWRWEELASSFRAFCIHYEMYGDNE